MQPLTSQEAQPLIQLQTRRVRDLRLQHNFVRAPLLHGFDRHADELRGDAATTKGFLHGQHGDVAPVGAGAVRLEFGDDDADEVAGRAVANGCGCGRERHEAQVAPLVEEVAVDVDAVGFGKVFGDELADGGEELFF